MGNGAACGIHGNDGNGKTLPEWLENDVFAGMEKQTLSPSKLAFNKQV